MTMKPTVTEWLPPVMDTPDDVATFMEDMMLPSQVADYCGVPPAQVSMWLRRRVLRPYMVIAGRAYFHASQFEAVTIMRPRTDDLPLPSHGGRRPSDDRRETQQANHQAILDYLDTGHGVSATAERFNLSPASVRYHRRRGRHDGDTKAVG